MSARADRAALTGFALVFVAAVGFSFKAILVKLAYRDDVDPITLLTLRMAFSLPFFLAAALWARRHQAQTPLAARDWRSLLLLGLIGYYFSSYLDFVGLRYISAGLERLILFTYPTLVLLFSALLHKRPIEPRDMVAMAICYGGIGLAVAHDASFHQRDLALGATLVFASAVCYAMYLLGSAQAIARFGVTRFTAYAMSVSCVAVIAQFVVVNEPAALVLPPRVYVLGFVMAIVSTVLPAFMLSVGIKRIGVSRASMVSAIGPVSTIVFSHLLLAEPITPLQIAGTLLVCVGTLVISGVIRR